MSTSLAEGQRRYHLADFHSACKDGGDVHGVQVQVLATLRAEDAWRRLTQTEAMASFVARASLRLAASTHYLLLQRGLGFPARLFGLLDQQDDAAAILNLHARQPCLFDSWSRQFVDQRPSLETLLAEESLLLLSSAAVLLVTNTFDVERLHSKNQIRGKAHRNHSLSLPDLAVWQLSHSCPKWCSAAEDTPVPREEPQRTYPKALTHLSDV